MYKTSKHFPDKIKSVLIKICSAELNQHIFFLLFLDMYFQRNSNPCYISIILSMLEEFRLALAWKITSKSYHCS